MSEPTEEGGKPPAKSSAAMRTILLLLVLLIVVAAGLWDWYGAKEPRDQAYDRVLALQGSSPQYDPSKPPTTQADVHKAVGVEPTESTTEDGLIYERFSWRRGIPWMTYDIWVLYRGEGEKEMLVAQTEGRPDSIYAANAKGGKPPMPDPSTVGPPTNGPPPEQGSAPASGEEASADDASSADAPAEGQPAEGSEGSEGETPAPAEDDAPASPEGAEEAPAETSGTETEGTETPAAPAEGEGESETP